MLLLDSLKVLFVYLLESVEFFCRQGVWRKDGRRQKGVFQVRVKAPGVLFGII